jgi:Sulfotransferase domain
MLSATYRQWLRSDCQLIALWAVPRSVSTAFEKTFSCRSGTKIVHEPFTDCYYFGSERRSWRYGDRADRSSYSASDAITSIFAESTPVIFIKDLCFQAEPYVPRVLLEAAVNTFIIRSPDAVFTSLAPLKPDFTEDEFGFVPLARMWHRVIDELGQTPIVVDGDVFRAHPQEVLRQYCERVGVSFEEDMLHWQDGRIRDWSEEEYNSQAKWHHTLEHSTGILPSNSSQKDPSASLQADVYARARAIHSMVSEKAISPVPDFSP